MGGLNLLCLPSTVQAAARISQEYFLAVLLSNCQPNRLKHHSLSIVVWQARDCSKISHHVQNHQSQISSLYYICVHWTHSKDLHRIKEHIHAWNPRSLHKYIAPWIFPHFGKTEVWREKPNLFNPSSQNSKSMGTAENLLRHCLPLTWTASKESIHQTTAEGLWKLWRSKDPLSVHRRNINLQSTDWDFYESGTRKARRNMVCSFP